MALRRIRPSRPLAPHGLPGHLVGFVEALRGSGISVGPSETVDAGRVMATLGLIDRSDKRLCTAKHDLAFGGADVSMRAVHAYVGMGLEVDVEFHRGG